jgi:hypothetical protein
MAACEPDGCFFSEGNFSFLVDKRLRDFAKKQKVNEKGI